MNIAKLPKFFPLKQGDIEIPQFWQLELTPSSNEEKVLTPLVFPDGTYLSITNICLPEITKTLEDGTVKTITDPVRVLAHVDNKKYNHPILIATLLPGQKEHEMVNVLFSPIDEVSLELKGDLPVHLSGTITPYNLYDYDEEEEEEEIQEQEEGKEEETK